MWPLHLLSAKRNFFLSSIKLVVLPNFCVNYQSKKLSTQFNSVLASFRFERPTKMARIHRWHSKTLGLDGSSGFWALLLDQFKPMSIEEPKLREMTYCKVGCSRKAVQFNSASLRISNIVQWTQIIDAFSLQAESIRSSLHNFLIKSKSIYIRFKLVVTQKLATKYSVKVELVNSLILQLGSKPKKKLAKEFNLNPHSRFSRLNLLLMLVKYSAQI